MGRAPERSGRGVRRCSGISQAASSTLSLSTSVCASTAPRRRGYVPRSSISAARTFGSTITSAPRSQASADRDFGRRRDRLEHQPDAADVQRVKRRAEAGLDLLRAQVARSRWPRCRSCSAPRRCRRAVPRRASSAAASRRRVERDACFDQRVTKPSAERVVGERPQEARPGCPRRPSQRAVLNGPPPGCTPRSPDGVGIRSMSASPATTIMARQIRVGAGPLPAQPRTHD